VRNGQKQWVNILPIYRIDKRTRMVIREKPKGMVILNKINDDSISEKDSEEEKDT
jgi:hypothetical protein